MYQTINFYQFRDAFQRMDRKNFSYEGLEVLFDFFEEVEDYELDVVAICCNYTENTPEVIAQEHGIVLTDEENEEKIKEDVLEYLEANTCVVGLTANTIIYEHF